jgi:hypothetical protein
MSLTSNKARSDRNIDINFGSEPSIGGLAGGLDSLTLRRSCTQQCLMSGRTLSLEEKACLSSCYQKGMRFTNKKHLAL